jgi:uncharacterized protein
LYPEKIIAEVAKENIWEKSLNSDSMVSENILTITTLSPAGGIMAIRQELLDILACPQCKGDIKLNEQGNGLICEHCKLMYEIKDDIPIMLIEKAKKLP